MRGVQVRLSYTRICVKYEGMLLMCALPKISTVYAMKFEIRGRRG